MTQLQIRVKEGEVFFSYIYAYDWNGNQILKQGAETDANWNWKKRLIRGYGITASEERKEETTYHYYHANEHGDIELVTNKKGEVCNQYQYDVFGGRRKAEERIPN